MAKPKNSSSQTTSTGVTIPQLQKDKKQLITLDKLVIDPSNQDAGRQYLFWRAQFTNFCNYAGANDDERLGILINKIEVNVYEYIEGITDINDALVRLDEVFKKKTNEVFARHVLNSTRQKANEPTKEFAMRLELLAKDCNYQAVSVIEHRNQATLVAFVSGLGNARIRQRLLETDDLTLPQAVTKAEILQRAEDNALEFRTEPTEGMVAVTKNANNSGSELSDDEDSVGAVANVNRRKPKQKIGLCKNCGLSHAHSCPAERVRCFSCNKVGHFAKLCKQRKRLQFSNMQIAGSSVAGSGIGNELSESLVNIKVNSLQILGLLDTGASECFMDSGLAKTLGLIMEYKRCGCYDGK